MADSELEDDSLGCNTTKAVSGHVAAPVRAIIAPSTIIACEAVTMEGPR